MHMLNAGDTPYMIMGGKGSVRRLNIDGSGELENLTNATFSNSVSGLDYDYR